MDFLFKSGLSRLVVFIAIFMLRCQKSPITPESSENLDWYKMKVDGFSGSYDIKERVVRLSWNTPSWYAPEQGRDFDFYRIFRLVKPENSLGGDSIILASPEGMRAIDKNLTSYIDALDLDDGEYTYYICAGRIVQKNGKEKDTVLGELSQAAVCNVVGAVVFTINRGDFFTPVDVCTLFITDPLQRVESVRFTQQWYNLLRNASGAVKNVGQLTFPIDTLMLLESESAPLRSAKWIKKYKNTWVLDTGVTSKIIPVFDALDSANSAATGKKNITSITNIFPWVLKKGNGIKTVFAELTYKSEYGARVDTLSDRIDIQPYRIQIRLRNPSSGLNATMKDLVEIEKAEKDPYSPNYFLTYEKQSVIYTQKVMFDVTIFADTTIAEDFEYWLMVPDSNSHLDDKNTNSEIGTYALITKGKKEKLTGIGQYHDEQHYYIFDFHPDSIGGAENMSVIYQLARRKDFADVLLKNNDQLFRFIIDTLKQTAHVNYQRFIMLSQRRLILAGKKEFWLILRFRGRFFDDIRTIVSNRSQNGTDSINSYFDFYPPMVYGDNSENNEYWIGDGTLITGNFTFALNQNQYGSVIDKGYARIAGVYLIVSDKSGKRINRYPYQGKISGNKLFQVKWEDIDPSNWPSGDYTMAIYTKDEFGNEGVALMTTGYQEGSSPEYKQLPNPWNIKVFTGK